MKNKGLKKDMFLNGTYDKIQKYQIELLKNGSSITNEIYKKTFNENLNLLHKNKDTNINNRKYVDKVSTEQIASDIDVFSDEITCYLQIQKARQCKRKRIEEKIYYALNLGYHVVFASLSFNDEIIKLVKKTRRNYIKKYLSQYSGYIANIDYGEEGNREHYHAIIFINPINEDKFIQKRRKTKKGYKLCIDNFEDIMMIKNKYSYGFTCFQLVKPKDNKKNDYNIVSKYIATLSNHAMKVEQQRVIYDTDRLVNLKKFNEFKNEQIEMKFY